MHGGMYPNWSGRVKPDRIGAKGDKLCNENGVSGHRCQPPSVPWPLP